MKIDFKNLALISVKVILVCGLLFSGVTLSSCADSGSDDGSESVGKNGFKIIGTSTNKDGSANVQCDGRAQSISLVFNVEDNYKVTVDGSCSWLTVASGAEGALGKNSLKLKVTDNADDQVRMAAVYITIGDKPRCQLATVTQGMITMDAIVKWMDGRLQNEYYWLDKYRELKSNGEINYNLLGSAFLNDALTGSKWGNGSKKVNKDDGYQKEDGSWHLFSYLQEYAATKAVAEPKKTVGFGIEIYTTLIANEDTPYYDALIEHVYPSSPAYVVGLQRGDVIKQINGQYIDSKNYANLCNSLQFSTVNTISVGISKGDSEIVTYDLAVGEFYQSPIAFYGELKESAENGIDFQGKKIGYISYLTFDSDYDTHLIKAMEELSAAGVTDMIIDLRSNGGGSVLSSSYFASMMLPESYANQVMVTLKRHELNEEGDSPIYFVNEVVIDKETNQTLQLPHLNLNSVYFITSDGTASASEMLIMGLRAQGIEAKTIGKQTKGKDCGMDVMTVKYGNSYYEFAPITFMNVFPDYDVNFSDGIKADIDFNVLKDQVQDEDLKEGLTWFPDPQAGAAWGNYLADIALGEAVANILGGTILPTPSTQAQLFNMPRSQKTRSAQSGARKTIVFSKPKMQGMYLRSDKVVEIE